MSHDPLPSSSTALDVELANNEGNQIFAKEMTSKRGRRVKPTSKMSNLIGDDEVKWNKTDGRYIEPGSRNFMAQFSDEERKAIEATEKLGSKEKKDCDYFLEEKTKSTKRPRQTTETKKRASQPTSTVKSRLAKKLKIKF